jgi:hypothetical protein
MTYFNGVTEKVEDLIPLIDNWGGPETVPHMTAILSQGGRFGGWSLCMINEKPAYTYNLLATRFSGRIHKIRLDVSQATQGQAP